MYRLTIVLALVLAASPLAAQTAPLRIGNFTYEAASDPIDDHDISEIRVAAEGGALLSPMLVWRCAGPDAFDLYLYRIPYTQEDLVTVIWRVDQGEPHTAAWAVTPNNAWSRVDANELTDAAEAGAQVAVRVVTRTGVAQTSIFRLTGVRRAMARLQCLQVPPDLPQPAAPADPASTPRKPSEGKP